MQVIAIRRDGPELGNKKRDGAEILSADIGYSFS